MRWAARVLGTVLLIVAAVVVVFEFENPLALSANEALLAAGFWIVVAGLVLAWRQMTAGGLLVLAGVAVRWIAHAMIVGLHWPGAFYPLAAAAGILYLISGLRSTGDEAEGIPRRKRRAQWVLVHAGGAGLFAALLLLGVLNEDFFRTPWVYESREARAARQAFEAREQPPAIVLFPMRVARGPNVSHEIMLTNRLARFLEEQDLASRAEVSEALMEIPLQWGWNQARMFRFTGERYAAQIKELSQDEGRQPNREPGREQFTGRGLFAGPDPSGPSSPNYALMVEILAGATGNWVGGIHYYLADPQGHLVDRGMINSHHPLWQEVQPEGIAGAYGLLERWLCESWTLGDAADCVPPPKPEPRIPDASPRRSR